MNELPLKKKSLNEIWGMMTWCLSKTSALAYWVEGQ